MQDNTFLLFKPPSVWYFVMTALADGNGQSPVGREGHLLCKICLHLRLLCRNHKAFLKLAFVIYFESTKFQEPRGSLGSLCL